MEVRTVNKDQGTDKEGEMMKQEIRVIAGLLVLMAGFANAADDSKQPSEIVPDTFQAPDP